jgi:hypothetical protein
MSRKYYRELYEGEMQRFMSKYELNDVDDEIVADLVEQMAETINEWLVN